MRFFLLFFTLIVVIIGCESENKNIRPLNYHYEKIQLRFSPEYTVTIDTEADSITRHSHQIIDTVLNGFPIGVSKSKVISGMRSEEVSDSIAFYCYSVICDTTTAIEEATSSYFAISLSKGSASYEVHFRSVSEWNHVSEKCEALYQYLRRNDLLPPK